MLFRTVSLWALNVSFLSHVREFLVIISPVVCTYLFLLLLLTAIKWMLVSLMLFQVSLNLSSSNFFFLCDFLFSVLSIHDRFLCIIYWAFYSFQWIFAIIILFSSLWFFFIYSLCWNSHCIHPFFFLEFYRYLSDTHLPLKLFIGRMLISICFLLFLRVCLVP